MCVFPSRRRHTRCALVTGVQTCALPICGSTNITSLNGIAPNVVLQTQGRVANVPMIAIRGMSTSDPDPNADPKVSTIIDGVYIQTGRASCRDRVFQYV